MYPSHPWIEQCPRNEPRTSDIFGLAGNVQAPLQAIERWRLNVKKAARGGAAKDANYRCGLVRSIKV